MTVQFTIIIQGDGKDIDECWDEAVKWFSEDPGCYDKYEIIEEEEDNDSWIDGAIPPPGFNPMEDDL